jgi:hypothetical protein
LDANPKFSYPSICDNAAVGGHLELIKWLRSRGVPITASAAAGAAQAGHLHVLEWMHEQDPQSGWIRDGAVASGAAFGSHDHILLWFDSIGGKYSPEICHIFAAKDRLDLLVRARDSGCEWYSDTICRAAARGGSIGVMRYLRGCDCPWDELACAQAARYGHLEMLKFLHKGGCPWNSSTTTLAAQNGQLAALQYALSKGCPWERPKEIHPAVRDWLQANGFLADHKEPT